MPRAFPGSGSDVPLDDWFLTAAERGNPATRLDSRHPDGAAWTTGNEVRPLVHGEPYFAELLVPGPRPAAPATCCCSPTGAATPTSGWPTPARRWSTAFCDGGPARCGRPRPGLAVAPGPVPVQRAGEPAPRRGDRGGRRRVPAGHAGAPRRLAPPEVRGAAPSRAARNATSPSSAASTCATAAATTPAHHGDPQRQPMAAVYGHRPPWHDIQLAIQGPAVGDVETVFRERWEDPAPLTRNPMARLHDLLDREDDDAEPAARRSCRTRRRAAITRSRCCAPTPTGGAATRSRRTANAASPAPTTRCCPRARSLIYLEDQYLWSTHGRGRAGRAPGRQPGAAPDRRAAAHSPTRTAGCR